MSKITEISSSNEAAVVNRILRRVNRTLDEAFGGGKQKSMFSDNEETAITNISKKIGGTPSIPPPPPDTSTPSLDASVPSIPFDQNDNPRNSVFAVSQHGRSFQDTAEPSLSNVGSILEESNQEDIDLSESKTIPEPGLIIGKDKSKHDTTNVSQLMELGEFTTPSKLKTITIVFIIALIGAALVYFWPLIEEIMNII